MSLSPICKKCGKECEVFCVAIKLLIKLYQEERLEEKRELLKKLRAGLSLIDWEVSEELEQLGQKLIERKPELSIIRDFELRVGFVFTYERKKVDGKIRFADCRKVTGPYQAYLPFNFLVTLYVDSQMLTANQKKVLMYHELKHITVGPKGPTLRPHDIEDWEDILRAYGLDWNDIGNEVPDILAGE